MYIRTITIDETAVLKEADEIIATELDNLNRKSKYCYLPYEIAKEIGIDGADLNSFLKDLNVIRKVHGCFHLTKKYRGLGLAAYRYRLGYGSDGRRKLKAKLVWTEEGRQFIKELIGYNH